ncbi:DJ-1/PfpI family protein [Paucibacter sp. M5-1]|uniref:DJ-1/PfpI family protein n=1 Tax=Paucibacter sp. M5-1 TaxID=3015998 RepID=UPI0022B8EE7A|nr:DJ-1/PfpI family protein [Paucibacter sp. M5-1]MCZ7883198.1 DJ-1/PfpI family protein [Paucibacter sp. M5-1]
MKLGIYLFDEVEVLDFAGPFEVFSTASRLAGRDGSEPPFEVLTLGPSLDPVRARAGLMVTPQYTLDQHPELDVLIVPGGVVTAELQRPGLDDWLLVQSCRLKVLASICTGAFLLEKAGLLTEREAITHWEDLDDLRAASQASGSLLKVLAKQRWVEAKPWVHHGGTCRLFTSAGISAGIDLSLHLVAELASPELARRTARQMDYDWRAANGSVLQAALGADSLP